MLSILSRIYVYSLISLLGVVIVMALTLHIALLAGSHFEPNGRFYAAFFCGNIPVVGLAESRNIWDNEVKQSPGWLRDTLKCVWVYTLAVMIICIAYNMHVPSNFFIASSAFMLAFTTASTCVLWATVRSLKECPSDFLQRTRRSLTTVALFSTFYLVMSLFPSKHVYQ